MSDIYSSDICNRGSEMFIFFLCQLLIIKEPIKLILKLLLENLYFNYFIFKELKSTEPQLRYYYSNKNRGFTM